MNDRGKRPGDDRRPPAGARRVVRQSGYTDAERRLARYVKAAYVTNRTAFESVKHGGEMAYKPPKKYDGVAPKTVDPQDRGKTFKNVWYEMARWFINQKVDAVSFVQYVFASLDIAHRTPEPLQVCSTFHLKGYRAYIEQGQIELIANGFEAETRTAGAAFNRYLQMFGALDPNRAKGKKWTCTANVVLSKSLPLSPLFRYLLALSSAKEAGDEGDEEFKYRFLNLARRFYDRAVVQFWSHKEAYAEHWKRWLPKDFAVEAERRYGQIVHNEETDSEDEVVHQR